MKQFEIYESNAGNLFLVVLEDGTPERIFHNFEFCGEGVLKDALEQLEEDNTAYESWEGDLVAELNEEAEQNGEEPRSVQQLYSELQENELIMDTDGDFYPEDMGAAAKLALCIDEEPED